MKLAKSLAVAALAASAGLLALAPAASAAPASVGSAPAVSAVAPVAPAPVDKQCALAAFDTAAVQMDAVTATRKLTLVVTGMKSATNEEIQLIPMVYVMQPEYWLIMVYGCSSGVGLPVLTPYTATLDLTYTVGTVGIEVAGSNQRVKVPVPPIK